MHVPLARTRLAMTRKFIACVTYGVVTYGKRGRVDAKEESKTMIDLADQTSCRTGTGLERTLNDISDGSTWLLARLLPWRQGPAIFRQFLWRRGLGSPRIRRSIPFPRQALTREPPRRTPAVYHPRNLHLPPVRGRRRRVGSLGRTNDPPRRDATALLCGWTVSSSPAASIPPSSRRSDGTHDRHRIRLWVTRHRYGLAYFSFQETLTRVIRNRKPGRARGAPC